MQVVYYILMSLGFSTIVYAILRMFRNQKVYNFRMRLLDAGCNYEGMLKFYSKLPSYNDMLKGWKPIRMENYFTKEEIEEFNNLENKKARL